MSLGSRLSVYTTRPHGRDEETTTWQLSAWMVLLAMFVVWANVVGWGIYGLWVLAAEVIA